MVIAFCNQVLENWLYYLSRTVSPTSPFLVLIRTTNEGSSKLQLFQANGQTRFVSVVVVFIVNLEMNRSTLRHLIFCLPD